MLKLNTRIAKLQKTLVIVMFSTGFFSCHSGVELTDDFYDAGVSSGLADYRKEHLSDIRYKLFFDIPSSSKEVIKGKADITCKSTDSRAFLLDFKVDDSQIDSILVNNVHIPYSFENEHIRIDSNLKDEENTVTVYFTCSDQSLNRRESFLYTLLVPDRARTVFPCFDQPDLKALYELSLEIPSEWKAVANGKIASTESLRGTERQLISFAKTEPLSTYLFSFVVGDMMKEDFQRGERVISVYHRETDPYKSNQCSDIAKEVFDALEWMENYTSIPYPFEKYDLIIVPGFQFGGMEHTGATLYTDQRMFLNKQSTLRERLSRSSLIAHETAHMWFGDYVTMKWFDDVWTKEVYANYFASLMIEDLYPDVNHRLNFMIDYMPGAYAEERTKGTNSIKQTLDNLRNAGLVYGNIIYNKSPLLMSMLSDKMGRESFRKGLQKYLKTYAFSNATWDDLIAILDDLSPENLKEWSHCWVNEKGRPILQACIEGNELVVTQNDEWNRNLCWPQELTYLICDEQQREASVTVTFPDDKIDKVRVPLNNIQVDLQSAVILPNSNGKGYGLFNLAENEQSAVWKEIQLHNGQDIQSEVLRGSLLINLYENLRHGNIDSRTFSNHILSYLNEELNPLLYSLALGYLSDCQKWYLTETETVEKALWKLIFSKNGVSYRLQAFRTYVGLANSKDAIQKLYTLWKEQRMPETGNLSERDCMNLAYTLALHLPEQYDAIIQEQYDRIKQIDRKKEFAFVSAAVSPIMEKRDSVFESLLRPENRRIEPWASQALSFLNHPVRAKESTRYIRPALDKMQEIQQTGDIFFPRAWAKALLSGHTSKKAAQEVKRFFIDNPNYPVMLGNKIKQQAGHLEKFN